MQADHACRTIRGADQMKRMNEMSVAKWWDEIYGRGKLEKPREKLSKHHVVHHETHIK